MRSILISFTVFIVCLSNYSAQELLYKNSKFRIFENKVIEGKFEAIARSDNHIISNYLELFQSDFSNQIKFKFSINGEDNEMEIGRDHYFYLDPAKNFQRTHVYKFGDLENKNTVLSNQPLNGRYTVVFRVDCSNILQSFNEKGFYKTISGKVIYKDDFGGIYIAGERSPLTWDFSNLQNRNDLKLYDDNKDGIYEVKITFSPKFSRPIESEFAHWKLTKDISTFPKYESPFTVINALYNLSLEEMLLDIRNDGAFMAGEKWTGVWTRDISYSILLSLAYLNPEACKLSLMKKVDDKGRIIQDTGTGGSWPISSDRTTWILAAWEVYKVTGDKDWLNKIYPIIKKSLDTDLKTVFNSETGLIYGESSFLDWREQTYPSWMDPKDIFLSHCIGTNAVFYRSFIILSNIEKELNKDGSYYFDIASRLKDSINKILWLNDKNYYSQFAYGQNYYSLSQRSETLGNSLAILFNVSDDEKSTTVIQNLPVLEFGPSCIYPQIPNIPPYHNNGIWPFVTAYYTWAGSKVNNSKAVELGLASIYRSASLFLTNKENYVAHNGKSKGTEINSNRQLWSVAGSLATIYRVFAGINFKTNRLEFHPFIPQIYQGKHKISNFTYRNSSLDIEIVGYGNKIKEFYIDDKISNANFVSSEVNGHHKVKIIMNNNLTNSQINIVENKFSLETPKVKLNNSNIQWKPIEGAEQYAVFQNGKFLKNTRTTTFNIEKVNTVSEYQVKTISKKNDESFLSEPLNTAQFQTFEPDNKLENEIVGYEGEGYVTVSKDKNREILFTIKVEESNLYSIDFRYSNGNGPINTNNKAAIRSVYCNGKYTGSAVMPQRGDGNWNDWGYSNPIKVKLKKGINEINLKFDDFNENMNFYEHKALIDHLRVKIMN